MSLAQRTQRTQRDMKDGRWQADQTLVNGITVAYDDVGEGDNVLVLVHGHPFDRTMWRPQVEHFNRPRTRRPRSRLESGSSSANVVGTEREREANSIVVPPRTFEDEDDDEYEDDGLPLRAWRAIVPDLRGYGESTVVPGKTTLDIFASDIAGLLDKLGIQNVVIGGLSMGGQIAMEFCRLYPERVRGILLAATFCRAETEEGRRQRAAMADRLLKEGMDSYAEEVLPKMVTPANLMALPGVADRVGGMMRSTNPNGAAAALRGRAERPDYAETLARLDVPALVVVGDEDAFTTRADAEQMSTLLKGSELVWIERVGHMPNLESEGEFNKALGRLLKRCVVGQATSGKKLAEPQSNQ
jgi:pimeloyl-ACP methyl ester carboxylesterase